jgi:hypothetical protein
VTSESVPAPPPEDSPADKFVDMWFADTFHNRPIDVQELNRLHAAKQNLKEKLRSLVAK